MSQKYRKNPYTKTKVILAPVSDEQQDDQNLEPPMVRKRAQNQNVIHLDAAFTNKIIDENDNKINTNNLLSVRIATGLTTSRIKRIGVNAVGFYNYLDNVNPRNCQVTFFSTNSGSNHTAIVPYGLYLTRASLMTALVTALNALAGASGLTFTITVNVARPYLYDITCVGGNFHFVLSSLGVKNGRPLWNLPTSQTDNAAKIIGPINLLYTRFIDYRSNTLVSYSKNPNASNAFGENNLIFRLYLRPVTSVTDFENIIIGQNASLNSKFINYNRTKSLQGLDISLYDEFGLPLSIFSTYPPAGTPGFPNPPDFATPDCGIFWNIILQSEI